MSKIETLQRDLERVRAKHSKIPAQVEALNTRINALRARRTELLAHAALEDIGAGSELANVEHAIVDALREQRLLAETATELQHVVRANETQLLREIVAAQRAQLPKLQKIIAAHSSKLRARLQISTWTRWTSAHCPSQAAGLGVYQHVETQLYDLRTFAQQRGYEVVCEYTDVGISGTKARRPGLDAMLKDARSRKFHVVLVAAFDRIARSTKHFLTVVDELDELGVEFVSRRENIDTTGAMGRMFLTALGAISELERSMIVERIKACMRRRKLEGLPLGRQPLELNHDALVRDRLSGMSLTAVAKKYGCSRASVVRFTREAQQRNFDSTPIVEQTMATDCVA